MKFSISILWLLKFNTLPESFRDWFLLWISYESLSYVKVAYVNLISKTLFIYLTFFYSINHAIYQALCTSNFPIKPFLNVIDITKYRLNFIQPLLL